LTPEDRIKLSGATRLLLHASELEFALYDKNYHIKSSVDFEKLALLSLQN
jgi:23S rRNA pseudouridine1911/1915/1917 synthase